jgi:uncharacterized repeat protein (TIGR01451 family)
MHRLTHFSATRLRRSSCLFVPALLVILLSLFVSIFSDVGSRAHAATQSALKNTGEAAFIHYRPGGYPATGLLSLNEHVANLSHINQSKSKQPALMLTRTNSPDTITHGKHGIEYVLSVSNGHFAGPVAAGNTITISNIIPGGVTDLTTQATRSAWKVQLASKTGPTILTATYVGSYPVLAGASLAPIIVHGTLEQSNSHHLLLPAIVRLLYTNNAQKSNATLQQQSAHVFTVTGGTTPKKVPSHKTPSQKIPSHKTPSHKTPPQKIPSHKTPPQKIPSHKTTPQGVTPQKNVPTYQQGQTVVYTLSVNNDSAAGPVLTGDSITVTDSIPAGLTGITASATTPADWSITLGGSSSPTTLIATYTGSYPVAAGATLSPITITGTLTFVAIPQVINTAVVITPNDSDTDNNSGTSIFNVVPLPDLTVTDPVPPGTTFEVGKPVTYTLTGSDLSSAGPVLGGDAITIVDTIPAGLTGITDSDSSGNWSLSLNTTSGPATLTATYIGAYPITPGMTFPPITITGTLTSAAVPNLANTATISTPKDSNPTNDTASNSIPVVPQPDLTVTKTTPEGAIYQVGLPAIYTITASNGSSAGPVLDGDPIIISDSIPDGLSGLAATANTPADWTVSLADTTSPTTMTATYTGAYPVAPGATLSSITLSGTLTAPSTPQLTNTATVTTPNDGNPDDDNGSNTISVLSIPDLTITNPVPPGTTFEVGKPVTYTLTGSDLSSAGSVLGGDAITIVDTIPAGLTGITDSDSSGNWSLSLNTTSGPATLTATYIGTYPVTSGMTLPPITITGTLTSAAIPNLANTATISTPKDTNPTNDTAANSIPVVPQPDLSLTKTIPASGLLQVGHSVTYALIATNGSTAGPVLGDPIIITDTIPAGFSNLTTSANSDWTVSLAGTTSPTTMTATYTGSYPIASGATLSTISLTGTLTAASHPQVTNTASVSTLNDGDTDNNNASITSPVLLAPDLSLSKTVALAPTLSVRRQSQGKPQRKPFHAAIGVKKANQAEPVAVSNRTDSKATAVFRGPQLNLSRSGHLIPTYQGGQQVTYNLTISDNSNAGPVIKGDPIVLVDKIPTGLTNLNATADSTYWQTRLGATTSPTTLTATYVGPYPVLAGARLPAVTLNGTLTGEVSQLTNTAQVKTPDDTGSTGANGHTGTTTIKVIPAPDLAITKTNFGGHAFYPGQMVQYELRVYSTNVSGPINDSVPIRVTDALPRGAYQVTADGTDWNITVVRDGKGSMVIATYIGHYPLTAGTWLPRIIVDARFKGHFGGRRVNTAQVIIPYDSNLDNNTARDTIFIRIPALPPTGSDPNA